MHFGGILDLSEVQLLDRDWHRRLRWAMSFADRQNRIESLKMAHALECGAITYLAGEKALGLHWKQAVDLQSMVQKLLFPWEEHVVADTYRKMSDDWEKAYGKLSDPETQKKIAAAVEALSERTRKNKRAQAAGNSTNARKYRSTRQRRRTR